jgi:crotonobetainyl-CoA:carnitine CoA-transferase CaiB-like acyl-CoA transferase
MGNLFVLNGIRILDSTHLYHGPYCSMLLGDLGAEIVKVEDRVLGTPPDSGLDFLEVLTAIKKHYSRS